MDAPGVTVLPVTAAETPSRRERPGKVAIVRAAVEVMGEAGYEGASIRDMASRAGVSVAALYYHFPSKHDLLREFLDESHDVVLDRIDRHLRDLGPGAGPVERLDEIVGTLVASLVHDEFAQLAANVAWREHIRLDPAARAVVDGKRRRLLDLVTDTVAAGVATGELAASEPREAARAIVTLATTIVEPYREMARPMPQVIALYQRFARGIARAG